MVARLTILLDDKTAEGFRSLVRNAERAADGADELEKELEQVERAVDDIGTTAKGIEFASMFSAVADGTRLLKDGFQFAKDALEFLAEGGSEAAQDILDAAAEIRTAFARVADDPALQAFFARIADQIRGEVIPAIHGIPIALEEIRAKGSEAGIDVDRAFQGLINTARQLNPLWLGTSELLGTLAEKGREAAAAQEQLNRQQEIAADLAATIGKADEIAAQAAEARAIQEIEDLDNINLIIEEKRLKVEQAAKAEKLTDEQKQAMLRELLQLEQRRVEIIREREQAEQKAANDEIAAARKAFDEQMKLQEQEINSRLKSLEQRQAAERKAAEERVKLERAEIDAKRKMLEQGGAVEQIQSQFTDQDRLKQVTANRQQQAVAEFNRENQDRIQGAAGDPMAQRRLEAERERIRRNVQQQTFRDNRQGRIGEDETAQATNQLTAQVINQGERTGEFTRETAQALRETAKGLAEGAKVTTENTREIESIKETVRQITESLRETGNARTRAQRR